MDPLLQMQEILEEDREYEDKDESRHRYDSVLGRFEFYIRLV